MAFTIEEKAFLLDYFRNKVKLVLLCIEEIKPDI
jgi:hypothetical protein